MNIILSTRFKLRPSYGSLFILSGWLYFSSIIPALAITWTNQQPADLVLGQANFTTAASGVTQTTLNHPVAVAIDPTSNKVFVSDYNNCRVLRFGSVTSLTNGAAAEAVLGQPNFTSNTCTTGAAQLHTLGGIVVDSAGRLWVSDFGNNRVLRFDNASSLVTGAAANGVLGQPDFTSNGFSVVTQSTMYSPKSVAIDSAGRLWVADQGNSRVLRFDNAASKANGANADGVLGQPDFTSTGDNTTQNGMSGLEGITIDSAGNLFVADLDNHRVLRFNNAAAKANGANADAVLGQPNFTSNTITASATGTGLVRGVAIDSLGQLYVSDADNNNRILVYQNAATLGNGAAASYVLGQPNFTSATANNGGVSAASLSLPFGLFFDNAKDSLWVADFNNSRILRYAPPEIQLLDGATDLPLNSTVNLGATNVGTPITKILTIKDLGNGNLNLTGSPMVSVTGTGFSVIANPAANIASANPSTFTLQFNPGAVGPATGTVSIVNNDSDENPFTFTLQGTAVNTVGSPVVVDRIDSDDTGSFAACTTAANDCSLRGAVAAVTAGGIINFDPSIAGQTITLSNTITLNKNLTIDGTGSKITISGNNAVQVFMVSGGLPTTFRALTIKNGNAGAGGGGGLFINGGSTTGDVIDKCTFIGNQANFGGAIYTNGWNTTKITITNSTLVNNQATNPFGRGGAFRSDYVAGEITNTTIANNQAASNGGGISIYEPSSIAVKNTIISLNTVNGSANDVHWETYSLPVTNSLFTTNPLFGPLQNNGGDTQTMALLTGSPAIDAGDAASCQATDQRGVTRPLDGNDDGTVTCDMGAVEIEGVPLPPSNFTATVISDTQINLAWQDNSFVETGYKIERNGTLIQTTAANTVTLNDTGLTCATAYNYTVRATNALGDSASVAASATTLICPSPFHLRVKQGATQVLSGETFAVGTSGIGHHLHISFTLDNLSNNPITLTGTPKFQWSSVNASEFSVDDTATTNPIPVGGNTTFILSFMPTSLGNKVAKLAIPNNDSVDGNYFFTVTGTSEPNKDLQITIDGSGQGSVTSSPVGVDCETALRTCSMPVIDAPRWVTLTAVPATGSVFTGWSGDPACQADGKVFVLADTACVATFELNSYILTVERNAPGATVTGDGINCPDTCQATYLYGTTVKLTAGKVPLEWEFVGWGGSCDSQGQVTISNDKVCRAQYREDPNIPALGDGNGDGQLDAHQANVLSLADKVTGNYITLEVNPECAIADGDTVLAETQPGHNSHYPAPQGLMYFDIQCSTATVTMYFHGLSKLRRNFKFRKFGPTIPGDVNTATSYEFPAQFGIQMIAGKPVVTATYTLIDGQLGDSTGVDGHIVDPGGIMLK